MPSDNKNRDVAVVKEIDFHGAAVIDSTGHEIAITEEMIQTAFDKLTHISMLPSKLK